MSFYSYKDVKVLVNDIPFYCQNASITEGNTLSPAYQIGNQYNSRYAPADGIGGLLKFSYLLTGQDALISNIAQENMPINVNFGGLYFTQGYLKSYSFSCVPNNPVVVNAEINFFDSLSGVFAPNYESAPQLQCLNIADCYIFNVPGNSFGTINNVTRLNYNYGIEVQPQYLQGQTIPDRIVMGKKDVEINLESDDIHGFISVFGDSAVLRIKLAHPENTGIFQNFDCRGVVTAKELNTSSNNILSSSITIKQNDLTSFGISSQQNIPKPVIYFLSPNTGYYGALVNITGKNLSYVTNISYKDNVFDYNFNIANDSLINSIVPNGAISGPITLYTSGNAVNSNQTFLIGGLPITVNQINPITGDLGSNVQISGANFYEISDVIFNENQEAEFSVINTSLIQAKVPYNTAWGYVDVISDVFSLSGRSPQKFVPIPNISGFSPGSGFSGSLITISGAGFSGISGATVNNLGVISYSVIGNTGVYIEIPSGNTFGFIRLSGQSGVSKLSLTEFYPYALITGIFPLSGKTGERLIVSGRNFFHELLYNLGGNNFAVGFQGGVTGRFQKSGNILLSGIIPSGAQSGLIHIYSQNQTEYPSSFSFILRHQTPFINYLSPYSGKRGGVVSIIGSEFYNITNVFITGNTNTGANLTSSNFFVSNTNDFINFNIPPNITGDRYDIIVSGLEGTATGSGLYVLENPFISGFLPTSGIQGTAVNLSGLYLYGGLTNIYMQSTGTGVSINSGSFNSANNSVQFYIPDNLESGLHSIIVYNTIGYKTSTTSFNNVPLPIISGLNPASGEWGNTVWISGRYLNYVTSGYIGATGISNYAIFQTTGFRFVIPNGATTDYVKLYNFAGYKTSANKLIIVPPLISISGFKSNPTYYGSGFIISGSYLDTTKEVRFSGNSGETMVDVFSVVNTTGLYMTVPGGISGGYPIKLVNDRGFSYSSQNLNLIPDALIQRISLQTGVFKDSLFISGSGLSGTLPYFISAIETLVLADNINRVEDTGLYFSVPSGIISNKINIRSRNDNFVATSGNFVVLPTISGVFGNYSYPTGQYITITGINFNPNDVQEMLGISGNNRFYYNIANPNEFTGTYKTGYSLITCRLNSNFAGTGKLFLISENDTTLDFSNFTGSASYVNRSSIVFNSTVTISQPAPIIYGFNPSGASVSGSFTISGNNLFSTTGVSFIVGINTGFGILISSGNNQFQLIPPNMATGTGLFNVFTPFGVATSGAFRVLSPIFISGYVPLEGHTGDYVRISGISFVSITGVSFGGYNANFIKSNELGTTIISGIVPTQLDCCGSTIQICLYNESENNCL